MKYIIMTSIFLINFIYANNIDINFQNKIKGYLTFKLGFVKNRRIAPSCPYDKCKNVLKKQNKIYYDKKNDVFYIKEVDYKHLLPILITSLNKEMTSIAASSYVDFFIKNYNYKIRSIEDKKEEQRKLEEKTNYKYKQLEDLFKKSLNFLNSKNTCKSNFYSGELYWRGYLNTNKNKEKAKKYFNKAKSTCKNNKRLYRKLIINLSRMK